MSPRTSLCVALAAASLLAVLVAPSALASGSPLSEELAGWLEQHGPLRLGVASNVAPSAIVEDGIVVGGWAVELAELAALKVGADVELVPYPTPAALVAALESGELDAVTGLSSRPDLTAFAEATAPLSWTPVVVAVGPGRTDVLAVDDLVGGTATTIPGSPIERMLSDGFGGLRYVAAPSLGEGLVRVVDGEVDAWVGPLAITTYQLQQAGREETLRVVGDPLDVVEVAMWAPPSPALEVLRAGRDRISDTELAVIHVRWTGFDLTDPAAADPLPGWLLPALLGAVLLALCLAAFVTLLRRQVAERTRELATANDRLEIEVEERTQALSDVVVRLRASNLSLVRFAENAAHDLKNPITAIHGLSTLAGQRGDPDGTMNAHILGSAKRLMSVVDGMLDDARGLADDAAGPRLSPEQFAEWLREVTAPELAVIDGELEVQVDADTLDAEPVLLRRVAMNLVTNAAKYAVNEAAATTIRVTVSAGEDLLSLVVSDNGPGIPRAQWGEVFERGARLHDDDRGYGLGLGELRQLVQNAGGSMRLGIADLGGLTVHVLLPLTDPPAAEVQAEISAARSPRGAS